MPARKRSTELSRTDVCARYMQEAIKPQQIIGIRSQVKLGDTLNVKTHKGCSVDEGMNNKTTVRRKGTVIGIFRNFAHVRLQSGVCESVLWADIMSSSMEDDDEKD